MGGPDTPTHLLQDRAVALSPSVKTVSRRMF